MHCQVTDEKIKNDNTHKKCLIKLLMTLVSPLMKKKNNKTRNLKQKTFFCELISKMSSQPTAQKRFIEKYSQHIFE